MKRILFLLVTVISLNTFGQGIVLKATTETFEVTTSSTADIDYSVVYYDITSSGAGLSVTVEGKITSATTTVLVSAPAGSTSRHIKEIFIKNVHASTANTLTFKKDISATEYQLSGANTLLASESILFNDIEGWERYSAGGVLQAASVSFQVDVQTFTSSGTWTKPTTFTPKFVQVLAWGAGGGGTAGTSGASPTAGGTGGAASSVRGGSGGGGGGSTVAAATAGAIGGNGGQGGGGGGGGGVGQNPGLGGAGGVGGLGYMIVITW